MLLVSGGTLSSTSPTCSASNFCSLFFLCTSIHTHTRTHTHTHTHTHIIYIYIYIYVIYKHIYIYIHIYLLSNILNSVWRHHLVNEPYLQRLLRGDESASIRQHTSAYISIRQRQHTPAYVSIREQMTCAVMSAPAFASIRQHTSAYVSR
jgi:hypothetical protein